MVKNIMKIFLNKSTRYKHPKSLPQDYGLPLIEKHWPMPPVNPPRKMENRDA